MIDLRDMQLLVALARHRHFARAAKECNISQPAFSARIRNIEIELQTPLVKRGNRFMGFTREGEIVIKWAHKLLLDAEGLRQEIEAARDELSGRFLIGAVPTALTYAAQKLERLHNQQPGLVIELISSTSSEIWRGLEEFSMDAGITYLEDEMPKTLDVEPLYDETYLLLSPRSIAPRQSGTATWQEAAAVPLCLLHEKMRNRRILNEVFAEIDVTPNVIMETNSVSTCLVQVETGAAATIAPKVLVDNRHFAADVVQLELVEPTVSKPMCLAIIDREPLLPAIVALRETLRSSPR